MWRLGDQGREQKFGDEVLRHTSEGEQCATEEPRGMGPVVQLLDSSMAVGGLVVAWRNSGDVGGRGASGGDVGPNGSLPRDLAMGKGAVIEEEETTEAPFMYWEEDVLFRLAVMSSSYRSVTKHDVVEYLSDEALAELLEDNPAIGLAVLEPKEERVRAIAASEATKRAERERKEGEDP